MNFFWRLPTPRLVVAPMVDQSELAWRMLCRRKGAVLCYTPMFNSKVFVRDASYRKRMFKAIEGDRPLVVQFCGDDAATLLEAAKHVEPYCDAISLNCGCPQGIARRGHYGAFLQDEWELLAEIVSTLSKNLSIAVECKIRIHDDAERTLAYAKMFEAAGCDLLTVHGRTREQKGTRTGLADWSLVKRIKEELKIPVVSNGNILYRADCLACLEETGVDGIMSSESNLSNPAMFVGQFPLISDLTQEYLELAKEHKATTSQVRAHLFRLWYPWYVSNLPTPPPHPISMAPSG
ncbi:uncharacterized protein MONBRDRAFT_22612 [Monosiga brevicollis MX1]|uniref:tRNA-dihydrouridine synthase n=1 Tax=Monosiga brevicollis TaxID=81824 RepID=A9UNJ4_MONBE|nr:uncharacterized protein MONBRDRAFT_22612 [Monosiga brevicollis MX1]EDQ92705.1 predicted protein [Monosiga brevicollis MX1]|eukprot:XP_001742467.1 hypothetical protein [Monosiga brevicollis MX1]